MDAIRRSDLRVRIGNEAEAMECSPVPACSLMSDHLFFFLRFVDGASRYTRVKKTQLDTQLTHFYNFYMFRAYLYPSSGGTTVCMTVCCAGWFPIQPAQLTVI